MTKPKEKAQKVVTQVELVLEIDGEIFDNTGWLNDLRDYLMGEATTKFVNVAQMIVSKEEGDDE